MRHGFAREISDVEVIVFQDQVVIRERDTSGNDVIHQKGEFTDLENFGLWIEDLSENIGVKENKDHEYLFDIEIDNKTIRVREEHFKTFLQILSVAKGEFQKNLDLG